MSYIPSLTSVIYEFKFEGRSGPEASGINRWIQVKMFPSPRLEWHTAIVSDTVDYRSDEVRYAPGLDQESQAKQLAIDFVNKHYGDEL